MKVTLEFNLPEEKEEFELMQKANVMSYALERISNEIFRPAREHGYSDDEIQKLIEESEKARLLVDLLEQKFYSILEEFNINV